MPDPFRLRLDPTIALHEAIESLAQQEPTRIRAVLREVNAAQRVAGVEPPGRKPLPDVTLSALLLSPAEIEKLHQLAIGLHAMVEKVLDHVISDETCFRRFFPDHLRIYPYLARTRGADSWQIISRYDLILAPDGGVRLLELNTGCPGGFIVTEGLADPAIEAFERLGLKQGAWQSQNMRPGALIDTILDIEKRAGVDPGLIAVLNDENELRFELEQIAASFRALNRESEVIDARKLTYQNGQLCFDDRPISVSSNKFRVSTPESPNHCWKTGFEERYAAFLAAQKEGAFVSINNLCGSSVAEDKGLLSLFREPEIEAILTARERELAASCIPWTARLEEKPVQRHGETIESLPDYVRRHPEQFVIKPANEGRGFGVRVGKVTSAEEWQAAATPDPAMPCIVQDYVQSVSLPIGHLTGDEFRISPHYLTLAMAITHRRPAGLLSRVSTEAVTNVAKTGFIQGIFTV